MKSSRCGSPHVPLRVAQFVPHGIVGHSETIGVLTLTYSRQTAPLCWSSRAASHRKLSRYRQGGRLCPTSEWPVMLSERLAPEPDLTPGTTSADHQ